MSERKIVLVRNRTDQPWLPAIFSRKMEGEQRPYVVTSLGFDEFTFKYCLPYYEMLEGTKTTPMEKWRPLVGGAFYRVISTDQGWMVEHRVRSGEDNVQLFGSNCYEDEKMASFAAHSLTKYEDSLRRCSTY